MAWRWLRVTTESKMLPLTALSGLEGSPLPLCGLNFAKMERELAEVGSVVLTGEGCRAAVAPGPRGRGRAWPLG